MKIRIEKPMLKSLAMVASIIEARDAYTGFIKRATRSRWSPPAKRDRLSSSNRNLK